MSEIVLGNNKTFSIRKQIAQLMKEDIVDPHELSQRIIEELSPTEAKYAMEELLVPYCRIVIANTRSSIRNKMTKAVGTSRWDRYENDIRVYRRVECIDGVYKPLGECTRNDISWIAANRIRLAKKIEEEAERYFKLVDHMESLDAHTVNEVPVPELMEILHAQKD